MLKLFWGGSRCGGGGDSWLCTHNSIHLPTSVSSTFPAAEPETRSLSVKARRPGLRDRTGWENFPGRTGTDRARVWPPTQPAGRSRSLPCVPVPGPRLRPRSAARGTSRRGSILGTPHRPERPPAAHLPPRLRRLSLKPRWALGARAGADVTGRGPLEAPPLIFTSGAGPGEKPRPETQLPGPWVSECVLWDRVTPSPAPGCL